MPFSSVRPSRFSWSDRRMQLSPILNQSSLSLSSAQSEEARSLHLRNTAAERKIGRHDESARRPGPQGEEDRAELARRGAGELVDLGREDAAAALFLSEGLVRLGEEAGVS